MDTTKLDWFYAEDIVKGIVKLSSDESRHLKVKRHYKQESVAVFDGKGKVGAGKIIDDDKIEIFEIHEFPKNDSQCSLTIATAVPKGDKFEFMLQKLTELNVKTIIPMKTNRSVVLPKNIERYKRILLEACKQSKRTRLPELTEITDFNEIIKEKYDNKIILLHGEEPLKEILKNLKGNTLVLVGPEGGFTDEELAEADKNRFIKASMGKLTLRIETAAIAAAAIINSF